MKRTRPRYSCLEKALITFMVTAHLCGWVLAYLALSRVMGR